MTKGIPLLLLLQEDFSRRERAQLRRTIAATKGIQLVILRQDVVYPLSNRIGQTRQGQSLSPIFSHHPLARGA
jgi:hypothetical protein